MSQKLVTLYCMLVFGVVSFMLWRSNNVFDTLPEKSLSSEKQEVDNFFFTTFDGREHKLHDFRGKIVFVNGWFSRCPPCLKEMPEFLELAERHPDKLVFIALSADRSKGEMLRYLEGLPKKIHARTKRDNVFFVYDEGKVITRNILKMRGYPETVIIDPEGYKLYQIKGVIDWLGPQVEKLFLRHFLPEKESLEHTHEASK